MSTVTEGPEFITIITLPVGEPAPKTHRRIASNRFSLPLEPMLGLGLGLGYEYDSVAAATGTFDLSLLLFLFVDRPRGADAEDDEWRGVRVVALGDALSVRASGWSRPIRPERRRSHQRFGLGLDGSGFSRLDWAAGGLLALHVDIALGLGLGLKEEGYDG
jgi:hypothetical protein